MNIEPDKCNGFLAIGDVCAQTSLSKSSIYDMMKRGDFPRPRQLTRARVAWRQSDIFEWLESRPIAGAEFAAS